MQYRMFTINHLTLILEITMRFATLFDFHLYSIRYKKHRAGCFYDGAQNAQFSTAGLAPNVEASKSLDTLLYVIE